MGVVTYWSRTKVRRIPSRTCKHRARCKCRADNLPNKLECNDRHSWLPCSLCNIPPRVVVLSIPARAVRNRITRALTERFELLLDDNRFSTVFFSLYLLTRIYYKTSVTKYSDPFLDPEPNRNQWPFRNQWFTVGSKAKPKFCEVCS